MRRGEGQLEPVVSVLHLNRVQYNAEQCSAGKKVGSIAIRKVFANLENTFIKADISRRKGLQSLSLIA